ncbi:MAG TPA: serine/threonine-protein kinase [Tepidisphaeraceae bacterium]|nr:serine/threonine-protein kinase [Tepidisphaeraceae bacterium]
MSETPDRAMEILADVLETPEEERSALLDCACAGEPTLRAEVERLLGLGPHASDFLERLELTQEQLLAAQSEVEQCDAGTLRFGRYRALRLIAEGGMGSVYEAQQDHPRRHVAVKVIKLGMDTRQVIARFEVEREALALMDHPNIAAVLDAGVSDGGRPFFVMELIKGERITKYCDENKLAIHQRVELFLLVCRAVQHAHQKGIIHRDLKPSNVLVSVQDGKAIPKIIDFGISKALHQKLTERTLITEFRELMGTPEYMSPEQAEMSGGDVDTRCDIYSLGVLLYELLTGTTPFDAAELRAKSYNQIQQIIREVEPPAPSTRISSQGDSAEPVAARRCTDPPRLAKLLRGELDWIVMKCLEKDRSRRYETANELAADMERYARNEPVQAGPPTRAYRLKRFVRRNRVPMGVAAAMSVLLIGGISGTTIGLVRARKAEARAIGQKNAVQSLLDEVRVARNATERQAEKSLSLNQFFQRMLTFADPDERGGGVDAQVIELLDRSAAEMSEKLKGQSEVEMQARITLSDIYWRLGKSEQHIRNLLIAYDLVRQTRSQETELGLRIIITTVDQAPDLPEKETVARIAAADARRIFGHHVLTIMAANVLGRVLTDSRNSAEAELLLRPVAQQWKQNPIAGADPFYQFGLALAARGKLDEAEEAFREAVRIGKEQGTNSRHRLRVANSLADLLVRLQKLDEADRVYKDALAEFRPRLGDAHEAIGFARRAYIRLLRDLGRDQEATQLHDDYKAALSAIGYAPARTHAAIERRARAHSELGQFKEAIEDYTLCIELDPTQPVPWFYRGTLLAYLPDRGAYDRHCRDMLERFGQTTNRTTCDYVAKVYLLVPRSPDECRMIMPLVDRTMEGEDRPYLRWFRMLKGLAEYRSGHFEKAVEWLNMARADPPQQPIAVAHINLLLAASHHRLDHSAEGQIALKRANAILQPRLPAFKTDVYNDRVENWIACVMFYEEIKAYFASPTGVQSN